MPQLPALATQTLDIGRILANVEQIRAGRTRNALVQSGLERQKQIQAARSEVFGVGGAPAAPTAGPAQPGAPTNALAAATGGSPAAGQAAPGQTNALAAGQPGAPSPQGSRFDLNSPAVRKYFALAPDEAIGLFTAMEKMDEAQLGKVQRMNEMRGRAAYFIESLPEDQRPAAYEAAIAELAQNGIPTDKMPRQYDPLAVQTQIALAMSLDESIKTAKPIEVSAGASLYDPRKGQKVFTAPEKADRKLVEIADPESPTGTRMVPRAQAIGKPGKGSKTGQDPVRVREARWLVKQGIAKDMKAGYDMARTKTATDPAAARAKGLAWVSKQEDRYGRPKYQSPEEIDAAMNAYMQWVGGDSEGALKTLKQLEKGAEPEDETGVLDIVKSLYQSVTGGPAEPAEAKEPAAQKEQMRAAPDGKEYPEVSDQAGYDALPAGAVYFHTGRGEFLRKGQ